VVVWGVGVRGLGGGVGGQAGRLLVGGDSGMLAPAFGACATTTGPSPPAWVYNGLYTTGRCLAQRGNKEGRSRAGASTTRRST
jgi:hypothetical protein